MRVKSITDLSGASDSDECLYHPGIDILMNVEALKAYTTLSAKEKHAVEKSLSNFFRLGIGEDNPRIISSQLQRHAFKRGRSRFQYALSCECGSGEGNKVNSRV